MTNTDKWPSLPWDKVVDRVQGSVFRLHVGTRAGTCFVVSLLRGDGDLPPGALFATAWHVLEGAVGTAEEITVVSEAGKTVLGSETHEVGFAPIGGDAFDAAVITARDPKPLIGESELLPLLPFESMMARGAGVGWLGFPGLAASELCFFHGFVAGYVSDPPTYLIDGVAVRGVSGGPAFDDRATLIGLVSGYIPDRVDGRTTLPGLAAVVPINVIRYSLEHQLKVTVL